jgi:hypothetical protein
LSKTIKSFVDHLLDDCSDAARNIVVGPVVWIPADQGRLWYFCIATGPDFHVDQFAATDEAFADECRWALIAHLAKRRPIVVHDMGDELQMAQWCEVIWPCAETHRIRAGIERERAARARPH